ncbi:MAG: TlpA family protein disulfide reductase, partial [Acidimicrobiia bacterium]|nr:TlpA family protein disulfide reductase [Acidimicrobiia bacterium]
MTESPTLTAERLTFDGETALQEHFHANGWTDGLPVVPPTPDAVRACLDWALLPPDHLIGVEPVRERAVTAEKVAINAVMAGCLPMHFPVVVTAVTAMLTEPFLLHGATASTGGCAVLVIVNGPIRREIGMNPTFN